MCGVVAVLHPSREVAETACAKAMNSLHHRGPDSEGQLTISTARGQLAMGHRRLAILDLTPTGAQPMCDPLTNNAIVYNGEIYNFRALHTELEQYGCRFRGTSDTEVLLAGYRVWGSEVITRLRGMFALVIWDAREQRLVFARDHAGMKPLYWYRDNDCLVIASEVQAILKSRLFAPRINREALATYFAYGSVLEPNSIIEGISMVGAGCWGSMPLRDSPANPVESEFWRFPALKEERESFNFKQGLANSIRGHLESDVPVGVFLSGGVDSTAVAETAVKISARPLHTFTVGFANSSEIDETAIAEETAARLGTCHQTVTLTDAEARQEVEKWLRCLDQPSLDGFNTYLVAKAASGSGLKVALSGLGGDELFGGYSSFRSIPKLYQLAKFSRFIPVGVRRLLAASATLGKTPIERARAENYATHVASLVSLMSSKRRLFSNAEMEAFVGPRSAGLGDCVIPRSREIPAGARQTDDIPAAIASFEAAFYMRDTLLRDSDISGMAHSLEIRLPLLDRDLMQAALSLPKSQRMGDGAINKPVLVGAAGPRTREVSVAKKRGFTLPYADWIRGSLRDLFEHGIETAIERGGIGREPVRRLFDSYVSGQTREAEWSRVWAIGVLGIWLDRMGLEH